MTPFKCRGCRMVSKVREVKYQSGAVYLICQCCGAENALRRDKTTETTIIPFEIVGVRPRDAPIHG